MSIQPLSVVECTTTAESGADVGPTLWPCYERDITSGGVKGCSRSLLERRATGAAARFKPLWSPR